MRRRIEDYAVVRGFLERVCRQVGANSMHDDIREELLGHIEERAEALISAGSTEEEAIGEAVRQMGEPEGIGRHFHAAHRPVTDWKLIILVMLFALLGVFASINASYSEHMYSGIYAYKAVYLGLGFMVFVMLCFADYQRLRKYSSTLFLVTLSIMAWIGITGGTTVNGSGLYVNFGPVSINYHMVALPVLLIALARMSLEHNQGIIKSVLHGMYRGALPAVLFCLGGSYAFAVLYVLGFLLLTWIMTRSGRILAIASMPVVAAGAIAFWINGDYILKRLSGFLYPDSLDGYFTKVSAEAVRTAGWFGHGFAEPNAALPDILNDSAFVYLIYCFGWSFGMMLMMLVGLFLARMWRIAVSLKESYAHHLAAVVIYVLGIRLIWPILMGLGLVPALGLDLPFLSFSGANQVLDLALLGLLVSMYRRKNMLPARVV
ncbi:FtsW/RodA/SpoVE family cell cycle protein [Paenibacillus sp. 7541]|uniref:FtsW/RodA/SpoVE family cell cycle protein n=1 Tax=Paenibacillus sp. 7541 TaxID=2026236 RepID=UPI000BA54573|nr:FtsW/RodA/SpoVE family cell cycle protein [Paenibacillus sp. 7541]PAK52460.1 hypothetical protein CHH75_12085 [Paenibacillus sp. 7541]